MTSVVIGLTGGIGSGKSAAADRFTTHKIEIIDADLASRAVVECGQPALDAIANHFGRQILLAGGELDRAALRSVVFADPQERKWLQALLHPHINNYLRAGLEAAASPYVVLAHPLLFETQQHKWCQRSLLIDVPEELQVARTMARDNNTQAQVENIMKAQASREQRLNLADDVISNQGTLAELNTSVDQFHATYLELCQK
jgi:dephospho-CoA kinase